MKHIKTFESFLSEGYSDDHPKYTYVELDSDQAAEYSDEIIKMILGAYADKGGHHDFKNANDIRKGDVTFWVMNDVDVDPEADLVIGGKPTDSGMKLTVVGQDGSSNGKKAVMTKVTGMLKTRGFYSEFDPALAQKLGLSPIRNEKEVRDVIRKDIKWNNDGTYDRSVGGKMKTKVLVGMPK
jgi:hypothetical protein